MKIERKNNQESMIGQFPEWEHGKVIEVFKHGGSCGLYMMCYVAGIPYPQVLISLERGGVWSIDCPPFDKADYAIEVKGKFVEEIKQ